MELLPLSFFVVLLGLTLLLRFFSATLIFFSAAFLFSDLLFVAWRCGCSTPGSILFKIKVS
jgi:hypothetical protein